MSETGAGSNQAEPTTLAEQLAVRARRLAESFPKPDGTSWTPKEIAAGIAAGRIAADVITEADAQADAITEADTEERPADQGSGITVSHTWIYALWAGTLVNPGVQKLAAYTDFFGVDVAYLFVDETTARRIEVQLRGLATMRHARVVAARGGAPAGGRPEGLAGILTMLDQAAAGLDRIIAGGQPAAARNAGRRGR
jgi:hypothetical protein